jgi:hypothetical protein
MPTKELCINCKHYWGVNSCDAFPDGIPDEIFTGSNKHSKPLKNQGNDLVFEKIDGSSNI